MAVAIAHPSSLRARRYQIPPQPANMHLQQHGIPARQMHIVQDIRPEGLNAPIQHVERLLQFGVTHAQTERFEQEDGRARHAEEDAHGREAQRVGLRQVDHFLQDRAAAVDDFLDELVVDGVDGHGADVFASSIITVIGKGPFDDRLHAE